MRDKTIKKLFSKHKGFSILIITIATFSILSLLSYLFWDKDILAWQRQNLEHFNKTFLIRGVVLLGKAWLLVWLLLCWALLAKCRKKAVIALTALFLLIFVVFPLKTIIHRPRPRDVINNPAQTDDGSNVYRSWSFPSGDTASVFAVVAAIFPFVGWPARSIIFALAGFIGVLRIVVFAHYLSDIFAGAAVGIIAGYLAYRLIVSRPIFRKKLMELFTPVIVLGAIIIIPTIIGVSNGLDDLFLFLVFYPPLVIILYLWSKVKKSYLLSNAYRG